MEMWRGNIGQVARRRNMETRSEAKLRMGMWEATEGSRKHAEKWRENRTRGRREW